MLIKKIEKIRIIFPGQFIALKRPHHAPFQHYSLPTLTYHTHRHAHLHALTHTHTHTKPAFAQSLAVIGITLMIDKGLSGC